jgi:hypothetical protein
MHREESEEMLIISGGKGGERKDQRVV